MLHKDLLARLCLARDMLGGEWDTRLPMQSVAAAAGMSVYHFSRVFRAVFGQSPHQHRLEARIRHARVRLALSAASVTEIGFATGFASPSTFSRVFAERVGCSPARYRKRVLAMHTEKTLVDRALHPGCLTLMTRPPKHRTI